MGAILVLDDNEDFRHLIVDQLRKRGHQVHEASSTSQGLNLALETKPDLILSDVWMDDGDGLTLLKEIRAHPEISTTPFIVMTGQPDSEGMLKGAEAAADGYLPKPFSMPTLFATVENRLGREATMRRRTDEVKGQLQRILQASPDLIGILDPETLHFLFLNAAGREILEMPWDFDANMFSLEKIFPASGFELLQYDAIPQALVSGLWTGENTLLTFGGKEVAVKQSVQAHRSPNGNVAFLSTIAHDLTEQKQVESALRQSEVNFRSLVNSLPDAVIMHDPQGRVLFSNARAEELFGFCSQEFQGRAVTSLWRGTDEQTTAAAPLQNVQREVVCLRSNGEEFPADVLTNAFDANGKTVQLTIIHDLSARRKLQRERDLIEVQLRQALKLESIGQLAAGIAHEINTPTQYIGDNIQFLRDSFQGLGRLMPQYKRLLMAAKDGPVAPELLKEIEKACADADIDYTMREIPLAINQSLEGVERVSGIVRAMKDFSHPGLGKKESIDINHAIESTITVARNEWKYVAELEAKLDRDLPLVPCLPGDFNQVILNLIVNAAHAIQDALEKGEHQKGKITVTTTKVGEFAEIRIADSGTGIPEQVRNRIFEPFFTTKEVGRGTGQGLAIARSVVVEKHGGTIHFETEIGRGTTFIIQLPLTEAAPGLA
jgi:PAS domain S-box-containing protein